MKNTKLFYLFLVFASIFLIACDDDEVTNELTLSQSEVALMPTKSATVTVKTGNGGYAVKSENSDVATATLQKGNSLTITAVKAGNTMVNVTDSKGKKAMVKVTVKALLALEKETVAVQAGATALVAITSGSGKYEVMSSKEEVATAAIEGGKVKVMAVAKGEATITVTDKDTKVKKELKVVVKPVLDIENADVAVIEGEKTTVAITDGTGQYTVASSDESVAKAKLSDKAVEIEGVSAGNATITLTDTDTQNVKEIKVVVKPILALEKAEVTVKVGEVATVAITKGTGSYEATSSDEGLATVKVEGEAIKVTAVAKGEATITVKDTDTNKEQTVKVTVEEGLKLEKTELAINMGETERVAVVNVTDDAYEIVAEPADVLDIKKGGTDYQGKYVDALVISPLKYNKEAVKVTVTSGGEKAVLMVTVNAREAINIKKTETELMVGNTEEIRIVSGNGGYQVTVDNADIVSAEVKMNGSDYVVALEAKAVGVANVTVTDAADKTVNIKITVKEKSLFNIDENGVVTKVLDAVVEGDIVVPAEGKIIASNDNENTPFKDNDEITFVDFNNIEEIGKMSLMNCDGLVKVELRKVTKIGMGAFANCDVLAEVYCYMEDPNAVTIGAMAFNGDKSKRTLYVPAASLDAYKASNFKNFFDNIEPMK